MWNHRTVKRGCGFGALIWLASVDVSLAAELPRPQGPFELGGETAYRGADVLSIAASIRARSDQMLAAMARRDPQAINAFYGGATAYVGSGKVGDWTAIVAGTASRYAERRSVECRWLDPFRIDVLARDVATVTATFSCDIIDQDGRARHAATTRLEVMRKLASGWTIVAFHEVPARSDSGPEGDTPSSPRARE